MEAERRMCLGLSLNPAQRAAFAALRQQHQQADGAAQPAALPLLVFSVMLIIATAAVYNGLHKRFRLHWLACVARP